MKFLNSHFRKLNDSLLWKLPLGVLLGVMAWGAVLTVEYAPAFCDRIVAREADKARTILAGQVADLRADTMLRLDKITVLTHGELDQTRAESLAAIAAIAERADARIADTTGKLDAQLTGLRADLTPTLQHVESITAHADEASAILLRRDALPAQLLGTLGAAKVTLGETAQTMRTVRNVTATEGPATAKALRIATEQAGGIATDVHTFTTAATAPVPWYRKVGPILYGGAAIAAHFK